ncbi:purine-cytosine permease family protein [Mycolicibacterium lutetiense]
MAAELLEDRSFDYVPPSERTGNLWSQTQLWFMINASFLTASTGALGSLAGLGLRWSVTAIVLGSVFGTLFQAFHGAQGPRMGLPQMIQSRAQFGTRGAVLPLVAATFVQFGFAIFYVQTGASSIHVITTGIPLPVLSLGVGVAALAVATIGYQVVMRAEKTVSYLMLTALVVLTFCAFVYLPIGEYLSVADFGLAPFLLQFGASATFQIAVAPVVSDYTRYLPERVSGWKVSATVFGGTLLSAIWIEILGALIALAYPDASTVAGFDQLARNVSPLLAGIMMIVSLLTCLNAVAVAFYSGSIAFLTAVEGFLRFASTFKIRALAIVSLGSVAIFASLFVPENALNSFSVFLAILTYFLIPWTAVNLTDYYIVRRGILSISDILKTDGGIYGFWGRSGMISYAVGFLAMIPFFSTSVWVGPAAAAIGGADFSFAVGLFVSGGLYLFLTRDFDRHAEYQLVSRSPINTICARSGSTVSPVACR